MNIRTKRSKRGFFNTKCIRCAKAKRTHKAQRIFRKPRVRIAHAAHKARIKIVHAAKTINQPVLFAPSQGIYRKIAAGAIAGNRRYKHHSIRMAMVAIPHFLAKGGNFYCSTIYHCCKRAVLHTRFKHMYVRSFKQLFCCMPMRISSKINIAKWTIKQAIAHKATSHPTLIAGVLERCYNTLRIGRNR